jgi:hypothetical protein
MFVITDEEKTILGNIFLSTFDVDEFFGNLKNKYNLDIENAIEFTEDNKDSIRKALYDHVIALSEEYCHISNRNIKIETNVDIYGVFDAIKLYEKNIGKFEIEDDNKKNYIKLYLCMTNIWWDVYHKDILDCYGYCVAIDSDFEPYSDSDSYDENNDL